MNDLKTENEERTKAGYYSGERNAADRTSGRITLGDDGKYRWVYEMSLFRNPTVFCLVWKIFFFIILGIFSFVMIVDAIEWSDFFPDRFLNNLKFFAYFLIGMTALTAIGYGIYALIMGGKYIVEFEMDEQGVLHRQIAFQAEKAKKIAKATMAGGLASGRLTTVGVGMNAQRTEMYSEFSTVRKVKAYPRRHLIKVNGLLAHNQVYVAKEDFEFVENYVCSHCVNRK